MKRLLIFLFAIILNNTLIAQSENDNCSDATVLCTNLVTQGNNTGATLETCATLGGCADDFPNFGLISASSVWYKFTTNAAGGNVSIDITNITLNPDVNKGQAIQAMIFTVPIPCQGQDFTQASNVVSNATTDFTLTSFPLTGNTTYYVIVDGQITGGATEPADASFEIEISGAAIDATTPATASISATNTTLCQGDSEQINVTIADCADTVKMDWYYNNSFIPYRNIFLFG